MKTILKYILITVLFLFGGLTLFLSTSVIFDLFGMRELEGNYVMFVVVANFISSWIYLIAIYGLVKLKLWSSYILLLSAFMLLFAFVGLQIHISDGGLYETKTVSAMIFRTGLTFLFSILAFVVLKKNKS